MLWGVVRGVGLVVLGIALASWAVYATVSMVRMFLAPKTRVHLDCGLRSPDFGCPASWTIDGRTVQGTASDPYSGHRYSRLIRYDSNAVLTMHVSEKQARMTPSTSSMLTFPGLFVFGVGMMTYPFWDKILPRGRGARSAG